MKVISFLAVLLALLAIVNAQTNTTAPGATNTTGPISSSFYPFQADVVKGGVCQTNKVKPNGDNNCCYTGFVTINKFCQVQNVSNSCQVQNSARCNSDESCSGEYFNEGKACVKTPRPIVRPSPGRKNGRKNNKRARGQKIKTRKAAKKARLTTKTNGFCFSTQAVKEQAAKLKTPYNKIYRECMDPPSADPAKRTNPQSKVKRNGPRRGKFQVGF